jgi:UDP-N-acetylglucosamine--N-acetylmuramyl-(pentapeptide) pyrophosphoryl-undecaprenol N-acetylglucosamine transferase
MDQISQNLKVLIAGGGTGGHIYTGIALAEELKSRISNCQSLFVGTRKGLERRIVPQEGYPIKYINVRGLKGKGLVETVRNLIVLPVSIFQSLLILLRFKPGLVIGVGGYASGPVCWTAAKLRIPVVIVEQNSIPGITNRMLSKYASFAAIAYEKARPYLKCRCEMTGVPLRARFYKDAEDKRSYEEIKDGLKTVLIIGGSQGAHGINKAMINAASDLRDLKDKVKIVHQTGEKDYANTVSAYKAAGLNAEVYDFIFDIQNYFRTAAFVISRAGAIATAEITYMGVPAVFVPLPNSIYDHQLHNAGELVERGAALMIKEEDFTPERIANLFREFIIGVSLETLRRGMSEISKINSSRLVIDRAMELLKTKKRDARNA